MNNVVEMNGVDYRKNFDSNKTNFEPQLVTGYLLQNMQVGLANISNLFLIYIYITLSIILCMFG